LAAALNVGAAYLVNVGIDHNTLVGGARLEEIGGFKGEVVGLHREERIGGDKSLTVKGEMVEYVDGSAMRRTEGDERHVAESMKLTVEDVATLQARGIRLEATEKLVISVGNEVALEMYRSGSVKLFGRNVVIEEG
ncbi:MAG TPA: hypothetical protein VJP78_04705, partial [Thermoleophilia bacterium]|nr:hypothetical protein [Thermoleophilia bacterium]